MVHLFRLHGINMAIDVNSGAVHVLDEASYAALLDYGRCSNKDISDKLSPIYGRDIVNEAIGEIEGLKAEGFLFSSDEYEGLSSATNMKPVLKALCLHISHDCNMRCRYCFASTGSFGGKRTAMPVEVSKKAIDFLILKSESRRNLDVDFFGGEPLLNFGAIVETVRYARSLEEKSGKKFKFTITTNALALNNEQMDFINEQMGNIVLSIDGRPGINDRMRTGVDGKGTYERILPRIKAMVLARGGKNYYVRGTYTRHNLDFSKDVMHLADLGFGQISVEPVVAAAGMDYDIREEDLPVIFNEYENLAIEYVKRKKDGRGFNFFHFMLDLSQGPCVIKRMKGCGSGHEYMAVTPEGDLYPCHQFVGMEGFRIGNIIDGTFDSGMQQQFKDVNVYTKEECRNCWARFYCSGGCAANASQFNRDIGKPYRIGCEIEKKRLECALWIKAQEC